MATPRRFFHDLGARPWRIHELTRDFRLEDVWALPGVAGPDDFPRLVHLIASSDPSRSGVAVRTLFAIRWKIGERWYQPHRDSRNSVRSSSSASVKCSWKRAS